jgi:hypothetical protein
VAVHAVSRYVHRKKCGIGQGEDKKHG